MDDSISRFWDNYISETTACNITERLQRWHRKHVKAYINAHLGRRLDETDTDDYIRELHRCFTVTPLLD